LEDILILRLERGRDFFISISGNYAPSSFGMQLEELSVNPEPIRSIKEKDAESVSSESTKTTETSRAERRDAGDGELASVRKQQLQIPKEIWRLCDALYTNHLLGTEGLFIKSGIPSEMSSIRESLDTGTEFAPCSPHSTAAVLFEFFRSLNFPLLSPALFPAIDAENMDSARLAKWCDDILSRLKPLQYNVFVYLLLFFKETLSNSEKNGLQADILIRIITPRLTWSEREELLEPKDVKAYQTRAGVFLKYLITQDYF